ncbi:hypothetical protein [Paenibacillus sp. SI8]|uniref:hypothetical protein n=1 Tax=unclassified Paenibacillus TaxID=185978 RepID=UPI0034671A1A
MDFIYNKLSGILERFGASIPNFELPFNRLAEFMAVLNPHLAQANILFPVDAVVTILIILGAVRAVLLVIWGIEFVRKMLPF